MNPSCHDSCFSINFLSSSSLSMKLRLVFGSDKLWSFYFQNIFAYFNIITHIFSSFGCITWFFDGYTEGIGVDKKAVFIENFFNVASYGKSSLQEKKNK